MDGSLQSKCVILMTDYIALAPLFQVKSLIIDDSSNVRLNANGRHLPANNIELPLAAPFMIDW